MTFTANVVRVLIASPSDVAEQRDTAEAVMLRWNAEHAEAKGILLMPVRWEQAATAESGNRPQAIVNRQIVDSSDVLIGIFWTRLGTDTGVAASGSVEEIERFEAAGKPVALFFSDQPVVPDSLDAKQWAALREFKSKQQTRGLIARFSNSGDFAQQLAPALTRIVRDTFGVADAVVTTLTSSPKAHVTASMFKVGTDRVLMLVNDGSGEAQQVRLRTEAPEGQRAWQILHGEEPINYLAAGQSMQLHPRITMGSAPRVDCFVTWTNLDGSEGSSRNTLTV
ncbi:hypothetical protein [Propioniciclava tarda]|uniref:DUF4062 domain-containing protein n=1 Tax=Propioniciclava tarda TaxID=433330 RepID=A0A4V2JT72_PROTD|nr:hypothetical protein [Propioniciclava tarda]TBT95111.1 hypothetical protein ET996_07585 [Propioniciclava tarda]SMO56159.1 Nucleoside 2-deoxyribosyltransferase [Propioniciclava tarda]